MKRNKIICAGIVYSSMLLLSIPVLFFTRLPIIDNPVFDYDFNYYMNFVKFYYISLLIAGILSIMLLIILCNTHVTKDGGMNWKFGHYILVTLNIIVFMVLILIDPIPREYQRFGSVTWTKTRWRITEEVIKSDEFRLVFIPELGDDFSLIRTNSRRLVSILKQEGIIMTIYRPMIETPGADFKPDSLNEFQNLKGELGIEFLPVLLIIGQGEIKQVAMDDIFDVLDVKLPYLHRSEFFIDRSWW